MTSIDDLRDSPSLDRIKTILIDTRDAFIHKSTARSLDFYAALVNHTIEEVYDDLPDDTLILLIDALRTPSGLAILTARISALAVEDQEDDISQSSLVLVEVLCRALGEVLCGEGPEIIHSRMNQNEGSQFNSLIYGSRIFSTLNRARHQIEKQNGRTSPEWIWLTEPKNYGEFVGRIVLKTASVRGLEKASKLGDRNSLLVRSFGQRLFSSLSTSQAVLKIFTQLRQSQQWHIISNVILPTLNGLKRELMERAAILNPFIKNHHVQLYEYPERLGICDISLCQLIVEIVRPDIEMVKNLIKRWSGSELIVKHNPVVLQETQTVILLLSLRNLTENDCKEIVKSEIFVNAISNRLSGLSNRVRLFGTVFAEELTRKAGSQMNFKLETDMEEQKRLRALATGEKIQDETVVEKPKSSLDSDDEVGSQVARPVDLPIYAKPENDEEDSDDDPTISQHKKVLAPVYLKDLVAYIQDSESYDKQYLSLTHGPQLVKRKRDFGREMDVHGRSLASSIAGMKNNFDIEQFEKMQLELLAETAKTADLGPHLAHLLFSGDYSLQQRMIILTSLALAVQNPNEKETFASKQLPGQLHQLFTDQTALDILASNLKSASIRDTASRADELIGGPKVLRISRRLANKRENKIDSGLVISSSTAAKYYFFPLIGEWHTNGKNATIGAYSDLFIGHLFKTLAILMSKATTVDVPDMTGELLDLILDMAQVAKNEAVVMDGVITALLVILQINDQEFLISHWPTTVVQIKTWLEDSWQEIPDEKVQQAAASALYELIEIIDKWQMKLIGII